MKPTINVANANGIDLTMRHAQVQVTSCDGTHPGDDEILLFVADVEQYETDLIQNGCLLLHFTKSQAQRLARQLLRMAQDLMTAEQRTDMEDTPIITISPELLNRLNHGKDNKRTI